MATRWRPNTCSCVVVFERDGDDVVCTEIEATCADHKRKKNESDKQLFGRIRLHNRMSQPKAK